MTTRSRSLGAAALALAVVLAACGSDEATSSSAAETTAAAVTTAAPTAVTAAPTTAAETVAPADTEPAAPDDAGFPASVTVSNGDLTLDAKPVAIVSLSPTATEMLFAIGAGDQVIAVDSFSNYPADAPITDLSGYEPNIEAIAGYEPDLVIVQTATPDITSGLGALDVPVAEMPAAATLDDVFAQIEQLGALTGNVADAVALTADMQTNIEGAIESMGDAEPLTYFHELDDTLFSVTSQTFVGALYSMAGLANVADAADPNGENGGYPQVSAEFLAQANPDLYFLADTKCCGQTAATVAARPGFGDLKAVTTGQVIELDDDIASRWGPRIVDFLNVIIEARNVALAS
jgi:iron complex transport system substrate-binding protein